MTPAELPASWRARAAELRTWAAAEGAAAALERAADELEAALAEQADLVLTLAEAAAESGFSPDHLRHLVSEGKIPNAGAPGRPRIAWRNLPRKARAVDCGFDAGAHARSILGGGR